MFFAIMEIQYEIIKFIKQNVEVEICNMCCWKNKKDWAYYVETAATIVLQLVPERHVLISICDGEQYIFWVFRLKQIQYSTVYVAFRPSIVYNMHAKRLKSIFYKKKIKHFKRKILLRYIVFD